MAFAGRIALITGAGSGIGRALARALAARGAQVVLADLDLRAAAKVAEALPGAQAVQLDVRSAADFHACVQEIVAEKGRLDLLFNNAGVGLAGEVRDTSLADWQRVIDVNLWGVVHGIDAAYPQMLQQGSGHIVNTASGAGLLPRPGMAAYAASKHAVVGLSRALRDEAAGMGVRVSAVCPGHIATGITHSTRYAGLDGQSLQKSIPFAGMPAEVCARRILRGVARNRPLIMVNLLTRLEHLLFRLWPALGGWLGRYRLQRMRAFRQTSPENHPETLPCSTS